MVGVNSAVRVEVSVDWLSVAIPRVTSLKVADGESVVRL